MRQVSAEQRLEARNARVGEFIQSLTQGRGAAGLDNGTVTRITVRLPTQREPEALLVVKASTEEEDFVGFVGGLDVVQAVLTWRAKDARGGLKWRVDQPWSPE